MSIDQCWGLKANPKPDTQKARRPGRSETPIVSPDAALSPCIADEPEAGQLDWLLDTLRQATEALTAADMSPLQKANAVSRLGNLYLKMYRAAELQQENRELKRRAGQLEQQLAAAHAALDAMEAAAGARRQPGESDGCLVAPGRSEGGAVGNALAVVRLAAAVGMSAERFETARGRQHPPATALSGAPHHAVSRHKRRRS